MILQMQSNDSQRVPINRKPKLHDISSYLFNKLNCINEDGFLDLDFKISEDLSRELDEKIENYIIENKMKLEVSFGDILFTGTFDKYESHENTGLSSNEIGFLFVLDDDTSNFSLWRNCKKWTQHLNHEVESKIIEQNLYYREFFYSLWEDPKISLHLKYQYWLDEKVFDIYDDKHILRPKN